MTATLRWGILGTGAIARTFAEGLAKSRTGRLLAVASRTQETADRFGDALGVPRRYGSYEALLADAEVQAVYVATPHPMHAAWAIRTAEARKHILCEKPLAMNSRESAQLVRLAAKARVAAGPRVPDRLDGPLLNPARVRQKLIRQGWASGKKTKVKRQRIRDWRA